MNITTDPLELYLRRELGTAKGVLVSSGLVIAISIVILIANALALVIFSKRTLRSKKSSLLLMNMTVADVLVGLTTIVLCISFLDDFLEGVPKVSILLGCLFLFQLSISASIISLTAISIERAIAVFWPFSHRLARKQHYYLAIGSVWLLASGNSISFYLFARSILSYSTSFALTHAIFITSCSTLLISYLSIWIKMKFFMKIQQSRTMQENKNLTKTLFIVTVVSLVTWSPLNFPKMFDADVIENDYDLIFKLLLLSNSFINVIIYSCRIPEFKKTLKDMLCICRLNSSYEIGPRGPQQPTHVVMEILKDNPVVIQLEIFRGDRI